jgi:hypothetical protein
METLVEVDLGKTEEDGNDIYGTDNNLNELMVEKIIKRVMNEPTFRRGKLETQIYILGTKDKVEVSLGLFDEWGGENNEDGDVWDESPEYNYEYDLVDFS